MTIPEHVVVAPFFEVPLERLETYVGRIVRLVVKEGVGSYGMTEIIGRLQMIEMYGEEQSLYLEGRDPPILMDNVAQASIALRQ